MSTFCRNGVKCKNPHGGPTVLRKAGDLCSYCDDDESEKPRFSLFSTPIFKSVRARLDVVVPDKKAPDDAGSLSMPQSGSSGTRETRASAILVFHEDQQDQRDLQDPNENGAGEEAAARDEGGEQKEEVHDDSWSLFPAKRHREFPEADKAAPQAHSYDGHSSHPSHQYHSPHSPQSGKSTQLRRQEAMEAARILSHARVEFDAKFQSFFREVPAFDAGTMGRFWEIAGVLRQHVDQGGESRFDHAVTSLVRQSLRTSAVSLSFDEAASFAKTWQSLGEALALRLQDSGLLSGEGRRLRALADALPLAGREVSDHCLRRHYEGSGLSRLERDVELALGGAGAVGRRLAAKIFTSDVRIGELLERRLKEGFLSLAQDAGEGDGEREAGQMEGGNADEDPRREATFAG